MRRLFLYLSLFTFFEGFSQDINTGSRLTSMANSGVALQDIWSAQLNQAGLTALQKPAAAIAYQSNLLNTDIKTQTAVFAYPMKGNVFAIAVQSYGFSSYKQQKAGLSWAKAFGKSLSLALNLNFHQVQIENYGNDKSFSVETGLQYRLNRKLTLATHISNPGRSAFDSSVDAVIPTSLQLGSSYQFSEKLLISASVVSVLNYSSDFRAGLEYKLADWFAFRGGMNANPFRQFGGFGYTYKKLSIDAAAAYHPNLGYSPQVSLGYEF